MKINIKYLRCFYSICLICTWSHSSDQPSPSGAEKIWLKIRSCCSRNPPSPSSTTNSRLKTSDPFESQIAQNFLPAPQAQPTAKHSANNRPQAPVPRTTSQDDLIVVTHASNQKPHPDDADWVIVDTTDL